jgi:hypothetical protein
MVTMTGDGEENELIQYLTKGSYHQGSYYPEGVITRESCHQGGVVTKGVVTKGVVTNITNSGY